jgi:hypothetical protein
MSFPIDKPTFNEAYEDFKYFKVESFKNLMIKDDIGFINPNEDYKKPKYYIRYDVSGMEFADYFHFESRMCADNGDTDNSPICCWFGIDSSHSAHVPVEQFRPSVFKCLLEHFKSTSVLDCKMQFGERLSGFMAYDKGSYLGLSVDTTSFLNYEKQTALTKGKITLNVGVPRLLGKKHYKKYDMVFDDFSSEEYLSEELGILWKLVSDGGNLVIYDGPNSIIDIMKDFKGCKYTGCIGYSVNSYDNACTSLLVFKKDL